MTLNLPKPVAAYFTADKADSDAVSQCFTENAVVKDEGHTYKGRAAIKKWKADASAKYQYTCEPFACEQNGRKDRRHMPAHRQLSRQSRLIFGSSSNSKATRSRRWKSSRD